MPALGPPTRVLIVGTSTRAAAESAARAGFAVTTVDAFADLDQHPSVRALSPRRGFGPRTAVRTAAAVPCDAVAYLSSFENHPDIVAALAANRTLWGNSPAVLREVRDPECLTNVLAAHGLPVPALGGAGHRPWLLKPVASGGGARIRHWRYGNRIPRGYYVQEEIAGTPGSVVFAAHRGQITLLGVSRQLVGLRTFGAAGFRYCGSILSADFMATDNLLGIIHRLAETVTREFNLIGVNGIDFIVRDGVPHTVEVNPRWSASMELAERAYGISVFEAHAAACTDSRLTCFDLASASKATPALGKAIVYARQDVTIGDTRAWLADTSVRDVPHEGERIRAGRPVCTVFATGDGDSDCQARLEQRAAQVYAELITWEGLVL